MTAHSFARLAGVRRLDNFRQDEAAWFVDLFDTYLLASPPLTSSDIDHLSDQILNLIGRFAPKVVITSRGHESIRSAVTTVVFNGEVLLRASVSEVCVEITDRIVCILEASKVLRRAALEGVCKELHEACRLLREDPLSAQLVRERLDDLRPQGKVRGYTYQGIKGLEFVAVAILDVTSKYMPHYESVDLWDDLRRLYVAVTRSQRYLLIHALRDEPSCFVPIIKGRAKAADVIPYDRPWRML